MRPNNRARVAGIIPEQQRVTPATPTASEAPPGELRQNKAKQVRFDVPRVYKQVRFNIPTPTEENTIPRHLTAETHDLGQMPPTRRSNRQRGPTVQEVREQEAILADIRPTRQPTRPTRLQSALQTTTPMTSCTAMKDILTRTEPTETAFRAAQLSQKRALNTEHGHSVNAAIQREFQKMENLEAGPLMAKGFKAPAGVSVLPSFGFVTFKTDAQGNYSKTTYRLVPNGKIQDPASIGETYSATIRLESKLMAVAAFAAAHKHMKILTFDITGAFLQCNWSGGELYVRLPDDTPPNIRYMGETHLAGRVVEVRKAWYGLKESNYIFSNDLKTTMGTAGYEPTNADSQIYVPRRSASGASLVGMHVDDGVFCYTRDEQAEHLLSALRTRYGNDLTVTYGHNGTPLNHAGHVFVLHKDHLEVNQVPHIKKCLAEILGPDYGNRDVRSRHTPSSSDLFKTDRHAKPINSDLYRKRVGMLLYLQTCYDISKEVNYLAAHVSSPTSDHEIKMRKVAQYLKGRLAGDITLRYPRNCSIKLTAWADAAFNVHTGARSQFGAMLALNPNSPPFWVSCGKLPGVPVSAYEAEYLAAFKTCLRIEATVQFLQELAHVLGSPHIGPVLFREDNMSVIKLTEAPDIPKRSRHINVKYHKVRLMARTQRIEFRHLRTELMTADILTKPFGPKRFRFLRDRLLGNTTTGQEEIED